MFIIGSIFAVYLIVSKNRKTAILDQDGIWIRFFGFIAWNEIIYFNLWKIPGTPVETIAIQVKDPKRLSQQASLSGKISLFWSKLFDNPHITLGNVTTSNEEILSFARKYIST